MCGIAGLLLSPEDLQRVSVDDMIKTLGLEIESRGRDATGVARLTASNRLRVTKNPCRATEFFSKHPAIGEGCRLALIHTRAATLGDPRAAGGVNNHPITSGPITLIHNGIISNDNALFTKYGWRRVGEVDSEVIPTAINNLGWKEGLELVNGSCAVAWHDMEKPGHLFVARHSSNPIHIGVSDSGTIVFASTNAAVAKAMAVLGATEVKIDPMKEGVMFEAWIDDDGKLCSNVEEFEPPKSVWSRSGSYEYGGQGSWFPRGPSSTSSYRSTGAQTAASVPAGSGTAIRGWDLGQRGYVLRLKDDVVFQPVDTQYGPVFGQISHFGAKTGYCYVTVDFDWGVEEELHLPLSQLLPTDVYLGKTDRKPEHPPIELPAPLALPPALAPTAGADDDLDLVPRTLGELIEAIEEIFGEEVLDLLPISWDREANPTLYDIADERDVIDIMEVE